MPKQRPQVLRPGGKHRATRCMSGSHSILSEPFQGSFPCLGFSDPRVPLQFVHHKPVGLLAIAEAGQDQTVRFGFDAGTGTGHIVRFVRGESM